MNNDKRIRESMDKYASGRYSKLEFLFAVSHRSDITETLSEENSNTEGYSWDKSDTNDSTIMKQNFVYRMLFRDI